MGQHNFDPSFWCTKMSPPCKVRQVMEVEFLLVVMAWDRKGLDDAWGCFRLKLSISRDTSLQSSKE